MIITSGPFVQQVKTANAVCEPIKQNFWQNSSAMCLPSDYRDDYDQ